MDISEAIRERRTVGAFTEQPIERDLIEELIEAAVWAPNHKHTEPWRFHVVSGAARDDLAGAVMAELEANGASPAKDPRAKLKRAPLFVAITQTASPDDPVRDLEDYAACCCATQNLTAGGACARTGGEVEHGSAGGVGGGETLAGDRRGGSDCGLHLSGLRAGGCARTGGDAASGGGGLAGLSREAASSDRPAGSVSAVGHGRNRRWRRRR